MNKKQILQNISVAFLAQGVGMLLSIIQSLIVPVLLGVREFGYWQLYLFYVSYVGFFHFGLSSGVYLVLGGLSRDEMDKDAVKSQFIFGVIYQSIIAVVVCILSQLLPFEEERSFVIFNTGIYLVLQNAATYMMNTLQCMNETKKSSVSKIIERVSFFVPLVVLMFRRAASFKPFVLAYSFSTIIQLFYLGWNLRDFIAAKWLGLLKAALLSIQSIKIGINLMLANIASMLILGIARYCIDSSWGIETFGQLSLALSLVSFFLSFVSQASMVLFPALRQSGNAEVTAFFSDARDALSLIFPVVYCLYFPMVWLLSKWLPNYLEGLDYLVLLLPICVFDSKMSVVGNTYFNVLRKERAMLLLNIAAAALSFAFSFAGVYIASSVTVVICGMTATIILRSIIAESYISKQLNASHSSISITEILITVSFVILTKLFPSLIAAPLFVGVYATYLFAYRERLGILYRKLRSR